MKNYLKYLLTAILMVSVFAACDEEPVNKGDGSEVKEGSLDFSTAFGLQLNTDDEEIVESRAATNTDEYVVVIYNTTTNEKEEEWIYKNVPEIINLKVGNYRIEAHSETLDLTKVSNNPYYYGSVDFKIEENKVTTIDKIICKFYNIKVQILFSDELASKLDEGYTATVNIGKVSHTFTSADLNKENNSFIFFPSDNDDNIMIVEVDVAIDKVPQYIDKKQYQNIARGKYYRITFDAKGNGIDDNDEGQMDGLTLKLNSIGEIITKDVNIPAEETVIDPGTTDPEPGPTDPEPDELIFIVGKGFNIDQPQIVPKGGRTIIVNMQVEYGIKNLFVEFDSPFLTEEFLIKISLAKKIDLAYPGSSEVRLRELNLPVMDQVIDKTDLDFDISDFTGLILDPGTHNFILTVVDNQNNSLTKTLSLITY